MAMRKLGAFGALMQLDTRAFARGARAAVGDMKMLKSQFAGLNTVSLKNVTKNFMNLKTMIGGMVVGGAVGRLGRSFAEYQQEMANVGTMLKSNVGPQMRMLEGQMLHLNPILGDSTTLTKALYQALSGGVEPAKAVQFVADSARAAKGGVAEATDAINAAVPIMKNWGIEAGNITDIYDQMFVAVREGRLTFQSLSGNIGKVAAMFRTAGLSTQEMFAAVTALSTVMDSTEETMTALKSTISTLLSPSTEAKKVFDKFGIATGATAIQQQGLMNVIGKLNAVVQTNRDEIANLFPNIRAFNGVAALAGDLSDDFAKALYYETHAAGASTKAFQINTQTLSVLASVIKNELLQGINEFGTALWQDAGINVQTFSESISGLSTKIKDLGMWMAAHRELLEYGLLGMIIGKGTGLGVMKIGVLVGGIMHLTEVVKTQAAAVALLKEGYLEFGEVATANFTELRALVDAFDAGPAALEMAKLKKKIKETEDTIKDLRSESNGVMKNDFMRVLFGMAPMGDVTGQLTKLEARLAGMKWKLQELAKAGAEPVGEEENKELDKFVEEYMAKIKKFQAEMAKQRLVTADEATLKKRLQIEQTISKEIQRLTLDEVEYKQWALDEQIAQMMTFAEGDKALVNQIAEYRKLKEKEINDWRISQNKAARDKLLDYTKQQTLSEYDYKQWQLAQEIKSVLASAQDKKAIEEDLMEFRKAKLAEFDANYNSNLATMAEETLQSERLTAEQRETIWDEYMRIRLEQIQKEADAMRRAGESSVVIDTWLADKRRALGEERDADIREHANNWSMLMKDTSETMASSLQSGFFDIFKDGVSSLSDVWDEFMNTMLESWLRTVSQMLTNQLLFGSPMGQAARGGGGLFGFLAGLGIQGLGGMGGAGGTPLPTKAPIPTMPNAPVLGMRRGGVFDMLQHGSILDRPTLLAHRGGVSMAGEAGKEAVVPLTRDSRGNLGIAGGGDTYITMNVSTPDVGSFRASSTQIMSQMKQGMARSNRNN